MHRTLARLAFATALATGGVMAFAGGPPAVAAAQTATFECTGATQSWVVPANVTSATFDVLAAQGGVGDNGPSDTVSSPAGLGGHTTATIAVTPGETIEINVGCAGSDSLGNAGAPGGFGGSPGGDGGIGGDGGTGGGGGGSSDVRQGGTALTDRAVVAGGGGGSGGVNGVSGGSVNATATEAGGGGDGGGLAGDDGVDGNGPATLGGGGGGGGTQSLNGSGGNVDQCDSGDAVAGDDGTDGAGGDGGTQPTYGAGGGGGGGYHSGGGGGGCVYGGGGGGGAGFALETATGVVNEVGVQEGDGQVVVTFTAVAPAVITPAPVKVQPAFTG